MAGNEAADAERLTYHHETMRSQEQQGFKEMKIKFTELNEH